MKPLGDRKRTVAPLVELSLTPMIDVVFLLLIFFMVGMRFRVDDRELAAPLPRAGPPPTVQTPPLPEIWISLHVQEGTRPNPQPRIVIDQLPVTTWAQAHGVLARLAQMPGAAETYRVIIAPDDDVPHDWVVTTLDHLHRTGYTHIAFKQ